VQHCTAAFAVPLYQSHAECCTYLLKHAGNHRIDACHVGWLPVAWQANWSRCWDWGAIRAIWARHAAHLRSRWWWCQLRAARTPTSASAIATAARATVPAIPTAIIQDKATKGKTVRIIGIAKSHYHCSASKCSKR
jgi:hypothetical protein